MTIDMIPVMERDEHLCDDQLESYSIGNLAERHAAHLEEHVLICETCQDRLAETDSWVRSIRRGALKWSSARKPDWIPWTLPRLVPVLAAIILIVAAIVVLRFSRQGAVAPLALVLEATRGPAMAVRVPSLQPLLLEPGLESLPPLHSYHLVIVDRLGKEVCSTDYAPAPGGASGVLVPGLPSGTYFVRLYDSSRTLLREFAMEARGAR